MSFALVAGACSDPKAEALVRELLIDPSSAEFTDVSSRKDVTCGFVNARNRVGGFTGPQPFIVQDGIAEITSDVPSPGFLNDLFAKCDRSIVDRYSRSSLNDQLVKARRQVEGETNAPN